MAKFSLGDIVVAKIPFTDFSGIKIRPAIILKDTNDDDFIIARITSKLYFTENDFLIENWEAANLHKPSTIRLHKIASLSETLIIQRIGNLTQHDLQQLVSKIKSFWSL